MSSPDAPEAAERQARIDAFFDEVLDLIGYDANAQAAFCEVRSRTIAADGETGSSNPRLSDDQITELLAMGRAVAMAIEVRDDLNFVQVHLVHFVTAELIDEIRPQ